MYVLCRESAPSPAHTHTHTHTDVLLCHDDELEERRIAFIYYLVPSWSGEDGGEEEEEEED